MQIQSRVFGAIDVDDAQVVNLTEPMPGFPALKRFVLLDPDPGSPFKWFQSLDDGNVCFLIADPREFFPDYRVEISGTRLSDLNLAEEQDAVVAVVLTAGEDLRRTTANLLAPLIFNAEKGLARQVILDGSGHPVRARLFEELKEAALGG